MVKGGGGEGGGKSKVTPPHSIQIKVKIQKHSVSIRLCCSGCCSCYEHFNLQYACAVFVIFKTIKCVSVKRFYTNNLLGFFALLGTASPTFYMSLHITQNLKRI